MIIIGAGGDAFPFFIVMLFFFLICIFGALGKYSDSNEISKGFAAFFSVIFGILTFAGLIGLTS